MAGKIWRNKAVGVSLDAMDACCPQTNESTTDCSELITSLISIKEHELKSDYRHAMVLYCAVCYRVFSDSLDICGEYKNPNFVLCVRVTEDVVIREEIEFQMEGKLAGCAYRSLQCAGCCKFVGVILNSAQQHLSALRNLFLLQKEAIICYNLNTAKIVKAPAVTFEASNIGKTMEKLKQELEVIEQDMYAIQSKLKGSSACRDG